MILRPDVFRRLCQARDMLIEVPEQPRLIDDVAREVGISPAHFIRQFESVFGSTPHQFRIQSRLDEARRLLARGQHSVTEVCMEVGFSSLGSFSTLFAHRIGASPSDYRRRVRSLVTVPGELPRQFFPGCLTLMSMLPASAWSQFSRSARDTALADSIASLSEARDAHQADQHHGR